MNSISDKYQRLRAFFTKEQLDKLQNSKVMIVGLGGVGGLVTEIIARMGIKNIILIDGDIIEESNFNRQIIALNSTLGLYKTEAFKNRILDIDSQINVLTDNRFIDANNIDTFTFEKVDLVLDLIDDVNAKVALIKKCKSLNIKIISSMGTGNKTDPAKFVLTDISKTEYCPLAKKMRHLLKNENIKDVTVCYSKESPIFKDKVVSSLMYCVNGASLLISKGAIEYLLSK